MTRKLEHDNESGLTWAEYKEREGFHLVVGVIGGMSLQNEAVAEKTLRDGLAAAQLTIGKFAVLSGGTEGGIPELSAKIATDLGLPTVGVYPADAKKYALSGTLGHRIPVESHELSRIKWGVESPVLTSLGDVYVLFGGEWGSIVEVGMIMKRNKTLVAKGEAPIPIIAIKDSGPVIKHIAELVFDFGHESNGLVVVCDGHELGFVLSSMFS